MELEENFLSAKMDESIESLSRLSTNSSPYTGSLARHLGHEKWFCDPSGNSSLTEYLQNRIKYANCMNDIIISALEMK
jgi:hypothetical protein